MITLLLKSYFNLLFFIGLGMLLVFCTGLYLIFRRRPLSLAAGSSLSPITKPISIDYTTIAGEDPMATQLDLAQAYVEAGMKAEALTILEKIRLQGNVAQKEEAERLLSL